MTNVPDEIDRLLDASAAIMALPIASEYRPGVRQFLKVARDMANALDAADLAPSELSRASVYVPPHVEPGKAGS